MMRHVMRTGWGMGYDLSNSYGMGVVRRNSYGMGDGV